MMGGGDEVRGVRPEPGDTPKASTGSALPASGENDAPSLVKATFLGREQEWVNHQTGEIGTPPIAVGCITFPDGGGELWGTVTKRRGPSKGEAAIREYRQRLADEREFGPEVAEKLAGERAEERARRSAEEAARRARCKVRRLCRRYRLNHMVTLTFPGEGVHEYDAALRLLQDFIHDHGDKLTRRGPWLAVPELHPGGHGWHWHVLVPRRFTRAQLANLWDGWTDYLRRHGLEPSGGAKYVRIDVKAFTDARAASLYAAKYVGKTFEGDQREKGRRRYLNARDMQVEVLRGGGQSLQTVRWVGEQIGADCIIASDELDEWHGPPMVWAGWEGERGPST